MLSGIVVYVCVAVLVAVWLVVSVRNRRDLTLKPNELPAYIVCVVLWPICLLCIVVIAACTAVHAVAMLAWLYVRVAWLRVVAYANDKTHLDAKPEPEEY